MVSRSVTILLCTVFFIESLFPQVELADISQLPQLWLHFEKHKIESPGITFLDFLDLHYGDSSHIDQDVRNHEKLPFCKNHRHNFTFQVVNDEFLLNTLLSYRFLMIIEEVSYFENDFSSISPSIWQPPKV